ncbi:MAG: hypothetical protein HKN43_01315 [Rhodothermales bacterium]|nr:hypothetical protein [Rhodothermales bacterium]
MFRPILFIFLASVVLLGLTPVGDAVAQQDRLRGGAFEVGAIIGGGFHANANLLEDCIWFGARAGHRFEPFPDSRFQMGFRTSFEGCYTNHSEFGRVDMIYVNITLLHGFKLNHNTLLYWSVGGGELLGDATPGGGTVQPRPTLITGPGLTRAVGKYLFMDVVVPVLIYENLKLGSDPSEKTSFAIAPNFTVGIQL